MTDAADTDADTAAAGPRSDQIIRAILDDGVARVVVAVTTVTTREAVRRHQAGRGAALALARGGTAGLLLATLTKDNERVTLQVLADGPLGGLTVDAGSAGVVRAYVRNPAAGPAPVGQPARLAPVVGPSGVVSVVRDLGLKETFRGQTALVSGEIDADVEHYLITSEQVDSALGCDAVLADDGARGASAASLPVIVVAGGILIQALPGSAGSPIIEQARQGLRDGALSRALAAAGASATASGLARAVLADLGLGDSALQILDTRPVRFECPCSRSRASNSLALLGRAELTAMLAQDGKAEVTCNFCRERYDFSEAELAQLGSQGNATGDVN